MASISNLGAAAGINGEALISQLLAVEQAPIDLVTAANSKLSTKLSTWGRIQSAFSALQDASATLNKNDFWSATTATSSNAEAVSVTTSNTSSPGSYSVKVQALAQAQYLATAPVATKTEPFGSGTLRIELGTFTDNPVAPPAATFAAKAAASAVNIDIGPGDNTLEKIRDKINSSNSGVTASLVSDASGVRLVLRGATGAENGFKVTATDDGANAGGPGLSALNYDPSADVTTMSATQKAGNAQATINGLEVTSTTNTLADVVDGLTIKLNKKTAVDSPAELTVSQDNESIKKGIDAFTSAYNSVVGTIRVQTLYDEASKTGGPLQGDSTAVGLLSQLRNMAFTSVATGSAFSRLSDIGIDIAKDGTMSTNSTKLNTAMGKLGDLKTFFTATDAGDDATKIGVSQRFKTLASQVIGTEGAISTKTAGIQGSIKRNEEKIERMEDRTVAVEKRLRAQYTALDASMTKLNGLSAYVTQQLSLLNRSS